VRVLALTRYSRRGASSRLRFDQFVPGLARHGIEVTAAPLLDDAFLARRYAGRSVNPVALLTAYASRAARVIRGGGWDRIWLEKEAFPWVPGPIERALAPFRAPWVVDFDDAWFHRYELHARGAVRALLGRKLDGVMRRASAVCAGNAYIADRARRAGASRVEIIPTVLDLSRYPEPGTRTPGPFTIGWVGTPLTAPYLEAVAPAMRRLAVGRSVRLCAVGARPLTIEGVEVVTSAWTEQSEAATIATFDAGIMPLPDSPWERGKCGYKLIQYMASRKPVIASPVGVNRELVQEGVNGFLATDEDSWTRALTALHDDPDRGRAMGAAGRRLVAATYELERQLPRLAELLRSAGTPGATR